MGHLGEPGVDITEGSETNRRGLYVSRNCTEVAAKTGEPEVRIRKKILQVEV